jgi:hypothetical protein
MTFRQKGRGGGFLLGHEARMKRLRRKVPGRTRTTAGERHRLARLEATHKNGAGIGPVLLAYRGVAPLYWIQAFQRSTSIAWLAFSQSRFGSIRTVAAPAAGNFVLASVLSKASAASLGGTTPVSSE